MKLSVLLISNFKGISDEIKILIDDIVVLVGPNNCCKSSILDAYESYVSLGSALPLDFFHNHDPKLPITITGIFTEVTEADIDAIGQEWLLADDPDFGNCAKFQIRWKEPGESGVKYSFSNDTNDWKEGGAGGWNSILKSRLPEPIRINPNDGTEKLEKVLKDLIAKSAQDKIKNDKSKLSTIIAEIEKLAKEVETEISTEISGLNEKIETEVQKLFQDIKVGFETGVGKFKPEDAIKDGSRFILDFKGSLAPLEHRRISRELSPIV